MVPVLHHCMANATEPNTRREPETKIRFPSSLASRTIVVHALGSSPELLLPDWSSSSRAIIDCDGTDSPRNTLFGSKPQMASSWEIHSVAEIPAAVRGPL